MKPLGLSYVCLFVALLGGCSPLGLRPNRDHRTSVGTAFFIGQTGSLLTAAHVVKDCGGIQVLSRTILPTVARVVWQDNQRDVALLRIDQSVPVAGLSIASGVSPATAFDVYGYAAPAEAAFVRVVHPVAVNSIMRRGIPVETGDVLWLSDPAIVSGWSGSPVVDHATGQVVGVVLAVSDHPVATDFADGFHLSSLALAAGVDALRTIPSAVTNRTKYKDQIRPSASDIIVRVVCVR